MIYHIGKLVMYDIFRKMHGYTPHHMSYDAGFFFMISEVYDVLTKQVVKCHLNFIMSWTTPWFYSMFCFNASILVGDDLHQSKSRSEGLNPLKSQKMTLG